MSSSLATSVTPAHPRRDRNSMTVIARSTDWTKAFLRLTVSMTGYSTRRRGAGSASRRPYSALTPPRHPRLGACRRAGGGTSSRQRGGPRRPGSGRRGLPPRPHRPHLDAEPGDARRVRNAGVQVRPREAEEVPGLDHHPQLGGGAHGLGGLGHHGDARLAGPDLLQVPLSARVLEGFVPVLPIEGHRAARVYGIDRGPPVGLRVDVGRPGVAVEAQARGPASRVLPAVGRDAQVQRVPEGPPQVHPDVPERREEQLLGRVILPEALLERLHPREVLVAVQLELRPHRVPGSQDLPDYDVGERAELLHRRHLLEDEQVATVDRPAPLSVLERAREGANRYRHPAPPECSWVASYLAP